MNKLALALLGTALTLLSLPDHAQSQTLKGVWKGTEVEVANGEEPGVTVLERPRLLIYTDAYFMWAFEPEGGPRPLVPPPGEGEVSDAEIGRVARNYQSVAGTYIRDGNRILYNRLVTLNPAGMLPENQPFVREIRTLTANLLETQATNAEGITTILRYARVE